MQLFQLCACCNVLVGMNACVLQQSLVQIMVVSCMSVSNFVPCRNVFTRCPWALGPPWRAAPAQAKIQDKEGHPRPAAADLRLASSSWLLATLSDYIIKKESTKDKMPSSVRMVLLQTQCLYWEMFFRMLNIRETVPEVNHFFVFLTELGAWARSQGGDLESGEPMPVEHDELINRLPRFREVMRWSAGAAAPELGEAEATRRAVQAVALREARVGESTRAPDSQADTEQVGPETDSSDNELNISDRALDVLQHLHERGFLTADYNIPEEEASHAQAIRREVYLLEDSEMRERSRSRTPPPAVPEEAPAEEAPAEEAEIDWAALVEHPDELWELIMNELRVMSNQPRATRIYNLMLRREDALRALME